MTTELDEVEQSIEEHQALAERAHAIDQELRKLIFGGRRVLWRVSELFYEFDEMQGWRYIGIESRAEWLADPEIGISVSIFYQRVQLWRELVVVRKIDPEDLAPLDTSKVSIVLPKIQMGKATVKEALDDAEALGQRDLKDKYIGARKMIGPPPADDDDENVIDMTPPYPSEEMWEEITVRATRRRQNLVKYIEKMTDWERVGDGDGAHREDWAIPDVVGGADGPESDDVGVGSNGDLEGLRTAGSGSGDRAVIDKAIIRQALKDWEALRAELVKAAESGQAHPRVDARLIRAGVQGANLLIEQWRQFDERSAG